MSFVPPAGTTLPLQPDGRAACFFSGFFHQVVRDVRAGVGSQEGSERDDLQQHLKAHADPSDAGCDDLKHGPNYDPPCAYKIFLAQLDPGDWIPMEQRWEQHGADYVRAH